MSGIANDHPRDRLSPYLDDELQVDERAAVDRHLARCPECRDELEAMERMAAAFADEPVPEMAEDLEVRVLHRLDMATILPLRRRSFFVPASIAATVAAVGLVSVIVWKQGGPLSPAPSEPETVEDRMRPAEQAPHSEATPPAAVDKLKPKKEANEIAVNAPAAPPPSPPAFEDDAIAQAPPEGLAKSKSDARRDDPDAEKLRTLGYVGSTAAAREKDAYAPAPGRDEPTLSRAASKPQAGIAGGVEGGVPGGVPGRVAAAALAPPCARGTLVASDEGRWSVADLPRGLDDLQTVLGAVGGQLEAFEPQSTRLATVVIPRERYDEWIRASKIQGVTGLADVFPEGDGDCVRQQIRIEQLQRP